MILCCIFQVVHAVTTKFLYNVADSQNVVRSLSPLEEKPSTDPGLPLDLLENPRGLTLKPLFNKTFHENRIFQRGVGGLRHIIEA